jgi:hypothetical protein
VAIHLLDGLYDAKLDDILVIATTTYLPVMVMAAVAIPSISSIYRLPPHSISIFPLVAKKYSLNDKKCTS